MRHAAWLVLALVLSGCVAHPTNEPRTIAYGATEPTAPACEDKCSHEWWNLSVEAEGAFTLRVPIPVVPPYYGDPRQWHDPHPWTRALHADGDGRARLRIDGKEAFVHVEGSGPLRVSAHRVREAGPSGHAEEFLLARWHGAANGTRPDALPIDATGTLAHFTLTYEAAGGECTRRAAYTASAPSGAAWAHGQDLGWCA